MGIRCSEKYCRDHFYWVMPLVLIILVFFISVFYDMGREEITAEENVTGIKVTSSGVKYLVDPEKIVGGGPPKDGIPSIDSPKFVSVSEAESWIEDNELVLLFKYKKEVRVYPLQIMVWHEIVNDFVSGDPILITYCPLCGSGIAYKREINGGAVQFGTSGKLYNSNLVMYDRLADTYWSQIDGKAIVGELVGEELEEVSIDTVSWKDFKLVEENMGAKVLSQDTGFEREYGRDPYGSYYEDSFLLFDVEETDSRIHPKTVIFGIEVGEVYKAYRESDLIEEGEIEDIVNGVEIRLVREKDGVVRITEVISGREIVKERDFWFAWYAFHPGTIVYEVESN